MDHIYHICTQKSWLDAGLRGIYQTESLTKEGFIHCSSQDQVLRVAVAFYSGQKNLVLLVIDPSRLKSEIRWEPGSDKPDERFPHIFGPINLDAVTSVLDFPQNSDGSFKFPSG